MVVPTAAHHVITVGIGAYQETVVSARMVTIKMARVSVLLVIILVRHAQTLVDALHARPHIIGFLITSITIVHVLGGITMMGPHKFVKIAIPHV